MKNKCEICKRVAKLRGEKNQARKDLTKKYRSRREQMKQRIAAKKKAAKGGE